MKKHEVYQKALMLIRILRDYGIEITATRARELIIERDNVVLDRDFMDHCDLSERCKDDLSTFAFTSMKTIADIAFSGDVTGISNFCKLLIQPNNESFYGIEIKNPFRASTRKLTINDTMIENMGCILTYEVLHALSRRDLSAFNKDDFIDIITGKKDNV